MAKKTKENNDTEGKSGKKGGKLVLILIILLLGAGIFFGVTFFTKTLLFSPKNTEASHEKASQKETDETVIEMEDELLVNLAQDESGSGGYLKVKIALGFSDPKAVKEFEEKKVQVNNVIIKTLRSKTMKEVSPAESQPKIEKELAEKIKELFDPEMELNVYFTEYLIQ